MLSTSAEFRRAIARNSSALFRADVVFADGSSAEISGSDVMAGSVSISSSTSSSGSFDIGAAVMGKLSFTLNNHDSRFDGWTFSGASVTAYVGKELDGGAVEWLREGVFMAEQPSCYGGTIGVECLDGLVMCERPYAEVATAYPATLSEIVSDICLHCGLTLLSSTFPNSGYVVESRPSDESLTCIEVLGFAAQLACCFVRCDPWGRVELAWYDLAAFEGEDWLDGESFDGATPYASGDSADGGYLSDYSSGGSVEGGVFGLRRFWHVSALSSLSVCTDDVVVTGLSVASYDRGDGSEQDAFVFGSDGYVLSISENPLVETGRSADVAGAVGPFVVGMRFRPFEASWLGDPSMRAGDPVVVTDSSQRSYRSYITSFTYSIGAYASASCSAETPSRNSSARAAASTKAVVEARRLAREERSARELALEQLARQMSESSGLFMTEEPMPDGSVVYYMHDKPTLQASSVVWKLTANAFAVSTDGGDTWPYGFDVNGDAILNRVYAIGLDACYINAGAINVTDEYGRTMFSVDFASGDVSIAADTVNIGSRSLPQALEGAKASFGTCVTASSQSAKTVDCEGFELYAGAVVCVSFAHENKADAPTLDVSGTGAKPIYVNGEPIASDYWWSDNDTVTFTYSGNYWCVSDGGTLAKIKVGQSSISMRVSSIESSAVTKAVEQFYSSTSPTVLSGGSWSEQQPQWEEGRYVWRRTLVTYGNGDESYTPSENGVCISGNSGRDGVDGTDGTDGLPGKDGASSYVHIKYSSVPSPTDAQMSETPSAYIGICTDSNATDPTTASSYTWSKWEGKDGTDGLPGTPGKDGVSTYVHFAYAKSPDGSVGFSTTPFDGALYVGVRTDNTVADSTKYSDYSWSLFKGADGVDATRTPDVAVSKLYSQKTYLEVAKSTVANTSNSAKGYIRVYGSIGGWVSGTQGAFDLNTRTRGTVDCVVLEKDSTISFSYVDIAGYLDSSGIVHVYAELNGYAAATLYVEGFDYQVVGTESTTAPSGTEIWRLSESQTEDEGRLVESASEIRRETSSQFEQLSNSFTYSINEKTSEIKKVYETVEGVTSEVGQMSQTLSDVTSFVRIGASGGAPFLDLGTTGSTLSVRLTNDRMSFRDNGVEVAYVSDQKLYITQAEITDRLKIGSYAILSKSSGHLSVEYVG